MSSKSPIALFLAASASTAAIAQHSGNEIRFDPDLVTTVEKLGPATEIDLVPIPTAEQLDAIEEAEKQDVGALEGTSDLAIRESYEKGLMTVLKDRPTNKILLSPTFERSPELLKIHSLNIGAGSCHVIQCPGARGQKMIIDCGKVGAAGKNDMSPGDVATYYASISSPGDPAPIVVSTHPDSDHYVYLEAMLGGRRPQSVWLGGVKASDAAFNTKQKYGMGDFYALVGKWSAAGVPINENFAPKFHNDGKPVADLECGAMKSYIVTVNTGADDNDQSLMVLAEYGNFRALFGGDAYEASQLAAAQHLKDKIYRVNLLTASHHGSERHGSNNAAWAEATRPGIIIYSSGKHYGHPHCAAVGNFWRTNSLYRANEHAASCGDDERAFTSRKAEYVTDDNGSILVASDGQGRIGVTCKRGGNCGLDRQQVRPPLDLEFEKLIED